MVNGLFITRVGIFPFSRNPEFENKGSARILASADILFNDALFVTGIKLLETKDTQDKFIKFPDKETRSRDGSPRNIAIVNTKDLDLKEYITNILSNIMEHNSIEKYTHFELDIPE